MARRKPRKKIARLARENFPAPRPKFVNPRVGRVPGYRKLSPSELRALGLPPKSERYEGPSGVISKRQYLELQREHFGLTLGRPSLEEFRRQREREGAPSARSLYQRSIDAYNRKYFKGKAKPGTVIKNERFQKLWKTFQRNRHIKGRRSFTAGATRAKALRALGLLRVDPASGKWTSDPIAA